jgi:transposase
MEHNLATPVRAGNRLVFESRRPIAHIAQALCVHREALQQWLRQAEGCRTNRPTIAGQEGLERLRKENASCDAPTRSSNARKHRPPSSRAVRKAQPGVVAGSG